VWLENVSDDEQKNAARKDGEELVSEARERTRSSDDEQGARDIEYE